MAWASYTPQGPSTDILPVRSAGPGPRNAELQPARLVGVTDRQGMNLKDVLGSAAKKMLADFDESGGIGHRESKGTDREANLLKNYLSKYLPRSVTAVHSGEAITVHGVIEVKSFLGSTELRDAWAKIAAIKRMPKKALRPNPGFPRTRTVYGKPWSYVPTCGLVFAYDGADLRTLGTTLVELAKDEGEDHP